MTSKSGWRSVESGRAPSAGEAGPPGLGGAVDDREVEALGVLVVEEVQEQLVGLVDDLADAGVRAVDLVDDEDDRQLLVERLAQDEAGLGQRALGGVHEQEHPVDHLEAALDLAAEVGVARGVDDVEGELAPVGHGVPHGRVLREDGDALLALQVHGVHDAVLDVGALAEGAGLPQHGVDEGGLAVVDVGDDGDVSQILADGHGTPTWRW